MDDIPYQVSLRVKLHVIDREWSECTRCKLGRGGEAAHVLYEHPSSRYTSDVLFVGEAPGEAEPVFGKPFVGASRHLLRRVVRECNRDNWVVSYTNLVACRPTENGQNRPPQREEVEACSPRLGALLWALKPTILVSLGREPEQYLREYLPHSRWQPTRVLQIYHPSYVLQSGGYESSVGASFREAICFVFDTVREINDRADQFGTPLPGKEAS